MNSCSPANVGMYGDGEDEVLFLAVEVCEGVLPDLLDVARIHLKSSVSMCPSHAYGEHGAAYPSMRVRAAFDEPVFGCREHPTY